MPMMSSPTRPQRIIAALSTFLLFSLCAVGLAHAEKDSKAKAEKTGEEKAAASGEVELSCVPDSGIWALNDDGAPVLRAALCTPAGEKCPQLTTLEYGEKVTASVSITPPGVNTCKLRPQGHIGNFALYRETKLDQLIGFDGTTLKVVTFTPQAARAKVWPSPNGDLLVLASKKEVIILTLVDGAIAIAGRAEFSRPREAIWTDDKVTLIGENHIIVVPIAGPGLISPLYALPVEQPIGKGDYAYDEVAILRSYEDDAGTHIIWQPWDNSATKTIDVDPEAKIIGFAASERSAAALLMYAKDVEVIARSPNGLEPRIRPRNTELRDADLRDTDKKKRAMLAGGSRWLLVDVGHHRRAVIPVNTEEYNSWAQMKPTSYTFRGRVVYVGHREFYVYHPKGDVALTGWALPGGAAKFRVPRAKIGKDFGPIVEAIPLERHKTLLVSEDGRRGVYNDKNKKWVGWPKPPEGGTLTEPAVLGEKLWAVATVSAKTDDEDPKVLSYYKVDYKNDPVELPTRGTYVDAATIAERLFGYCIPGLPCAIEVPEFDAVGGNDTDADGLSTTGVSSDPMMAFVGLGVALFFLIVVTIWRSGVGRKGDPQITSKNKTGADEASQIFMVGAQVAYDEKGRRVPIDADISDFVQQGTLAKPGARIGASLVAGLVVSLALMISRVADGDLVAWAGITVAIFFSVFGLVWFAASWKGWNRMLLLRFGRATEGEWVNERGANRAVYVVAGRTYELSEADSGSAIPVVLYDPKRPTFAIHYNGSSNFNPDRGGPVDKIVATGRAFNPIPLIIVLLIFVGAFALALMGRVNAYQLPVAESVLTELTEADKNGMLLPCLELCADGDEVCTKQCTSRQLGITLEAAGKGLDGDPDGTPGAIRKKLADRFAEWVGKVEGNTLGCEKIAAGLPEIEGWNSKLHDAFAASYGTAETQAPDEELVAAEATITKLRDEFFEPICNPTADCGLDRTKCAVPLTCSGDPATLQARICAVRPVVTALAAPPE